MREMIGDESRGAEYWFAFVLHKAVQRLQDSVVLRDVEGVEAAFCALRFQKRWEAVASVLSTAVKPKALAHSKAVSL
jgi:hypothetical protein